MPPYLKRGSWLVKSKNMNEADKIYSSHAATISKFSIVHTFQFAEWIARHYVRLNSVWVGRYADQRNKANYKDTGELFAHWIEHFAQPVTNIGRPENFLQ